MTTIASDIGLMTVAHAFAALGHEKEKEVSKKLISRIGCVLLQILPLIARTMLQVTLPAHYQCIGVLTAVGLGIEKFQSKHLEMASSIILGTTNALSAAIYGGISLKSIPFPMSIFYAVTNLGCFSFLGKHLISLQTSDFQDNESWVQESSAP